MKAIVFDNFKDKFNKVNKYLNIDCVMFESIKFKNGEGKIIIKEDVSNEDIVIFSDFYNSCMYTYLGKKREYSKDEYYVELKRLISALDNVKSISVFLPLIYQSRQNTDNKFESKDYLMFIDDLKHIGVKNIITFEAHGEDSRVISCSFANLFKDSDYDVIVSPDAGGVERCKQYSNLLDCDCYNFSKKRDLSHIVDGSNPIKAYSKSQYNFKNKKVLIVDDILDSGSTLINAIKNIDNAEEIDVFVAYPLFSKGLKEFKKLNKERKLNKIYISDLIYVDKKILKEKFIEVVDSDKLVSEVVKEVVQ